ncbi:histidine phosphatase family protein [Gracilibacillus caseinilyticus]|uniref:Histidine phosphatase family protein n=1 Tax=Gracilibacillus caseinilyticus TaxID=2932256 RepID=A0ABY4EVY2_9BACI|nr:histidine phosphatase family protein [Gracilibacillus caseinilyticus]UOQ48577.1 histidine phosphatase family protein [Gracilibacillus caseinilyticus]
METTIYMIRHAESPFVFGKERTRGISEKGIQDSQRITDIMRSRQVDIIFSSPYKRAVQTIEGITHYKKMDINLIEDLRERQLKGDFKMPKEERLEAIRKSFQNRDYSLPDGESVSDVQNRAIPVIKELLLTYYGKKMIIGTHGNVMTIIMNYFNSRYGFDFWINTTMPDIYELVFSDFELYSVRRLWD